MEQPVTDQTHIQEQQQQQQQQQQCLQVSAEPEEDTARRHSLFMSNLTSQ
jgi:hypothetical protein